MKKTIFAMLIAASMLTACVVAPAGRGHRPHGVVVAPILPPTVVLESDPYYFHDGYHYYYKDDRWYYSKARKGPWRDLPRDRYPKRVRYRGKDRYYDDRHHDDRRHDDRRHDDGRHDGGRHMDDRDWDDRSYDHRR